MTMPRARLALAIPLHFTLADPGFLVRRVRVGKEAGVGGGVAGYGGALYVPPLGSGRLGRIPRSCTSSTLLRTIRNFVCFMHTY